MKSSGTTGLGTMLHDLDKRNIEQKISNKPTQLDRA